MLIYKRMLRVIVGVVTFFYAYDGINKRHNLLEPPLPYELFIIIFILMVAYT